MKRIIFCICILLTIISVSAGWSVYLYNGNQKLFSLIDNAQALAETKDECADEAISELCAYWERFSSVAALFETSDRLDNISDSCAKLKPLYEKDNEEFFSECEVMRFAAERIFRNDIPFLPNNSRRY